MKRKIVSVLLCTAMVLGSLGMGVCAEEGEERTMTFLHWRTEDKAAFGAYHSGRVYERMRNFEGKRSDPYGPGRGRVLDAGIFNRRNSGKQYGGYKPFCYRKSHG